jgi:hypothetical protein
VNAASLLSMNQTKEISRSRAQAAWAIAVAADFLQIIAFPFFWEGAASPLEDALDLIVGAALTGLIGWHWSFVPSFVAKLVPALDLVPTWSAAVLLANRKTTKAEVKNANAPGAKSLAGETDAARLEREAAARETVPRR